MNGIYLLLGSNIGDKHQNLISAAQFLEAQNLEIIKTSSVYETAPWGKADQEWFLNVVIEVNTGMNPTELLKHCLETEKKMGRKRIEKWGSRVIDIDILYYQNKVIGLPDLKIPHPGIPERKFTILLLSELIPDEKHPELDKTQIELLDDCEDRSDCLKTDLTLHINE